MFIKKRTMDNLRSHTEYLLNVLEHEKTSKKLIDKLNMERLDEINNLKEELFSYGRGVKFFKANLKQEKDKHDNTKIWAKNLKNRLQEYINQDNAAIDFRNNIFDYNFHAELFQLLQGWFDDKKYVEIIQALPKLKKETEDRFKSQRKDHVPPVDKDPNEPSLDGSLYLQGTQGWGPTAIFNFDGTSFSPTDIKEGLSPKKYFSSKEVAKALLLDFQDLLEEKHKKVLETVKALIDVKYVFTTEEYRELMSLAEDVVRHEED